MTETLKVSVIGVGHLGSRHALRLTESTGFKLHAVFDANSESAQRVASETGALVAPSLDKAIQDADAFVVATSTTSHRDVAEKILAAGKPVLVEKPLTGNVEDAEHLVSLAASKALVLQVGHTERFNPAIRGLHQRIDTPLFVESHRLAPLVARSLDIDVIQDLMIHDIDLALSFIKKDPIQVHASGVPVITKKVDIANARLMFEGGITANLTASRVSLDKTRKFRMFLPRAYVSADCVLRKATIYKLRPDHDELLASNLTGSSPIDMLRFLEVDTMGPEGGDALVAEHDAFFRAIHGEENDGVYGHDALRVLRVMVAVEAAIQEQLESL